MALLKLAMLSRRGWPFSGKSRHPSTDEGRPKPPKAKKPSTSGPPCILCEHCSRLDLESMFTRETIEQAIGPLSNYSTVYCGFCTLVSEAIALTLGGDWTTLKLCEALDESPKLFMQSRSPLRVQAADGPVEYPQPRLLLALDKIPEGLRQDPAVLNKEVKKIKNRHIVGELECIPDLDVPLSIIADAYVTRREVKPRVDVDLVKEWLEECQSHQHSEARGGASNNFLFQEPGFRLIDVEEERLVQHTDPSDYIALSYVWGAVPTVLHKDESSEKKPVLLTTKENHERLAAAGGLSESKVEEAEDARVPNTVRDAMEFTRQLGMKYLWVDTLCIIQDDEVDKGRLMGGMDDVYANSTATLIAADGIDADAGLRGVGDRSEKAPSPVKIPLPPGQGSLNLSICLTSLTEQVRSARWNTRGWTFQEQALSQRCLYFTPTELFFNCSEAQLREGYAVDDQECEVTMRTGPPWWTRNLRKDPDPTPYRYLGDTTALGGMEYQAAVQDYMRKNLTYSDDVLNAFEGAFNRFSDADREARLGIKKAQAIPARLLYLGLLWYPSNEATKRPAITKREEGSLTHFSSWSWASWVGPVGFVFGESEWLSRNISYALRKRYPIHVATRYWHFGGSSRPHTTHSTWEAGDDSEDVSRARRYLTDKIGVDIVRLHGQEAAEEMPDLLCGELGFFGAYLPGLTVTVNVSEGSRLADIRNTDHHRGQFRFDGEACSVDEFVLVVSADTIRKPADVQSTLLGLVTEDGISRRVGVGFIYHSKEPSAKHPLWEYRNFRLR